MLLEFPPQPNTVQVSEATRNVQQYPLQWALGKAAFDGDEKLVNLLLANKVIKNNKESLKAAVLEAETAAPHRPAKQAQYAAVINRLQELMGP